MLLVVDMQRWLWIILCGSRSRDVSEQAMQQQFGWMALRLCLVACMMPILVSLHSAHNLLRQHHIPL
jgi:hypothetical protein